MSQENRFDVRQASNHQLAAWFRQFKKSNLELTCYRGHFNCGCSNSQNHDGLSPCSQEVIGEVTKRAYN